MIEYVFFILSWLYTATAIEAQAVQIMAKTVPPPPKPCECNYIMKEGECNTGDGNGKTCKDSKS